MFGVDNSLCTFVITVEYGDEEYDLMWLTREVEKVSSLKQQVSHSLKIFPSGASVALGKRIEVCRVW